MPFNLFELHNLTHEKIDSATQCLLQAYSSERVFFKIYNISPYQRLWNLITNRHNKSKDEFLFGLNVFSCLLDVDEDEAFYITEGCELHRAGLIFLQFMRHGDSYSNEKNILTTCLHDAIRYCSSYRNDLVELLLINGANPNLINDNFIKPIQLAINKVRDVESSLFKKNIRLVSLLLLGEIQYSQKALAITAKHVIDNLFSLDISSYFIKKIVRDVAKVAKNKAFEFNPEELIFLGQAKLKDMPPTIHLGELIDKGTYGHIYKGLMKDVNELFEVAIKCSTSSNEEYYLKREIAVISQMRHPNVLNYYGSLKLSQGLAFVMNYASRGNLEKFMMSNSCELVLNHFYSFAKQISLGLGYLHKKGYVHLDLKPSNILLDENKLMIADFGSTAKVGTCREGGITTIDFRSPERFNNKPNTFANDIYSLGVCLGMLATQSYAWEELLKYLKTIEEYCFIVEAKVRKGEQPSFGYKRMSTPVENLVKWCLFKDPTKRPTCDKVVKYLEHKL